MNYLSVCSGIEAATVAWHPIGWSPVAFSEIEAFPSAVLNYHHPSVPNWGDMTRYQEWPDANVDVLVGGTPCQSYSVAGLRKGLDDPRGDLMLTFGAIAERYRTTWVAWENVPGVLSSNGGRDFGTFLGMLAKLGYGFAYRVLDAQFYGVAQRRRRVFVVGSLRGWAAAAAVLFERYSLSGDPAPCRESGENIAPTIGARAKGGVGHGTGITRHAQGGAIAHCLNAGGMGRQDWESETLIPTTGAGFDATPFDTTQLTSAANYSNPKPGDPCHPLAAGQHPPAVAFAHQGGGTQTNLGYDPERGTAPTLSANQTIAIAIQERAVSENVDNGPGGKGYQEGVAYTLEARNKVQSVAQSSAVRRLTPRECERLQGFPDDFTLIPYRNGWAKDGPRYKALGNSMAVPVMAWIGRRIQAVDDICSLAGAA